jgi:hypothetical protein
MKYRIELEPSVLTIIPKVSFPNLFCWPFADKKVSYLDLKFQFLSFGFQIFYRHNTDIKNPPKTQNHKNKLQYDINLILNVTILIAFKLQLP